MAKTILHEQKLFPSEISITCAKTKTIAYDDLSFQSEEGSTCEIEVEKKKTDVHLKEKDGKDKKIADDNDDSWCPVF